LVLLMMLRPQGVITRTFIERLFGRRSVTRQSGAAP
jgi:hypothetical protein